MIIIIYSLLLVLAVSSFRWLNDNNVYNPNNPAANELPKYDPQIEEIPHHALIYYARLYCSGSVVSSRAIVTCAACFYLRASETVFVKVGTRHYLDAKIPPIRAIEVKVHEFYRRLSPVDNDVALIFLERHVKFSASTKKIPLVEPEVSLRLGHALLVSGYGGDNVHTSLKNHLLSTFVLLVENNACEGAFGRVMTYSTYCAKLHLPEQRLSDNGGGATVRDLLVGILVAGGNTGNPNAAIFTNVSYFHRWIVLNTQRFHEKYCNRTSGNDVLYEFSSYEEMQAQPENVTEDQAAPDDKRERERQMFIQV